jgi:predicted transcriptional regulator
LDENVINDIVGVYLYLWQPHAFALSHHFSLEKINTREIYLVLIYNIGFIMKKRDTYQLDDHIVEEIVEILVIYLDMSRIVGRTLTYLRKGDKATSIGLQKGTGLSQPEISLAMNELKLKGLDWVNESEEKKPSIGRPYKIYSLKVGFNDIIMHLEKQQKKAFDDAMAASERLKKMVQEQGSYLNSFPASR